MKKLSLNVGIILSIIGVVLFLLTLGETYGLIFLAVAFLGGALVLFGEKK